jgi:hypothetical protein
MGHFYRHGESPLGHGVAMSTLCRIRASSPSSPAHQVAPQRAVSTLHSTNESNATRETTCILYRSSSGSFHRQETKVQVRISFSFSVPATTTTANDIVQQCQKGRSRDGRLGYYRYFVLAHCCRATKALSSRGALLLYHRHATGPRDQCALAARPDAGCCCHDGIGIGGSSRQEWPHHHRVSAIARRHGAAHHAARAVLDRNAAARFGTVARRNRLLDCQWLVECWYCESSSAQHQELDVFAATILLPRVGLFDGTKLDRYQQYICSCCCSYDSGRTRDLRMCTRPGGPHASTLCGSRDGRVRLAPASVVTLANQVSVALFSRMCLARLAPAHQGHLGGTQDNASGLSVATVSARVSL